MQLIFFTNPIILMNEKKKIKNNFFDILSLFLSFLLSFFRGFSAFFFWKKWKIKNNFYMFLDFIFRIWPKYFWKSPNLYKIFSMPASLINYILKKWKN